VVTIHGENRDASEVLPIFREEGKQRTSIKLALYGSPPRRRWGFGGLCCALDFKRACDAVPKLPAIRGVLTARGPLPGVCTFIEKYAVVLVQVGVSAAAAASLLHACKTPRASAFKLSWRVRG
jgi:hypothetical protein